METPIPFINLIYGSVRMMMSLYFSDRNLTRIFFCNCMACSCCLFCFCVDFYVFLVWIFWIMIFLTCLYVNWKVVMWNSAHQRMTVKTVDTPLIFTFLLVFTFFGFLIRLIRPFCVNNGGKKKILHLMRDLGSLYAIF